MQNSVPVWKYAQYPTSAIDRPEGLGATHYELTIDSSVLPYLSHDNAKLLANLIRDGIKCRDRRRGLVGEIQIGDEQISVSRVWNSIVIGGSKDWKFSLLEAEKLCDRIVSH